MSEKICNSSSVELASQVQGEDEPVHRAKTLRQKGAIMAMQSRSSCRSPVTVGKG